MDLNFNCPHCELLIIINIKEINCGIFRHGVLKNNLEQINPHECKLNCDTLVNKDLIYGCGKPFQIIKQNDNYIIEICDYI